MSTMLEASACVPNIGPRERAKRMRSGVVAITIGVVIVSVLVVLRAPRVVRLIVFLPALAGALGVLQAQAST